VTALVVASSALGINDLTQVPDGLAELGRVQPSCRLQQDRFGLGSDLIGQLVGALGQDPGVGGGDLAAGQRLSGRRERPRNNARAVRTDSGAAPAPSRSRPRSQLAVEGAGRPRSAPAGPPGIHPGQFLEPLAFQAAYPPLQGPDRLGQGSVGQPVQVLGGQLIHRRRQQPQPLWRLRQRRRLWVRQRSRQLGGSGGWVEWVFESMVAT
jgi:hypothetical protein